MPDLRLTICAFLAAAGFALAGDTAQAQTSVANCLESQDAACVDVLNARLEEIENAMQDSEDQAVAKLGRVTALALLRRLDLAEAAVDSMPDNSSNPAFKDSAIVAIISVPAQDAVERGRLLLSRIVSPEYYETARAAYIINLIRTSDVDTALQELVATNQPGAPMKYVGVYQLAHALALKDRPDDALELVLNSSQGDEHYEGMVLESLVMGLIDKDRVPDAIKLLTHIKAPFWEAAAKSRVAAELSKNGHMADAEELFAQARLKMASLDKPEDRFRIFESFTRSAIAGGRLDFALKAVDDVSSFPADRAAALQTILDIGAGKLDQTEWRPIAHELISLRATQPRKVQMPAERWNNDWRRLATAVAVSGDSKLATNLVQRIPDKDVQQAAMDTIAIILIHSMRFQEAVAVLQLQPNRDRQVQGYIRLSQIADNYGQSAVAEKAIWTAIGLVEGPDFVPVSDSTVSMLARYESRTGQYEEAELRLQHIEDQEIQVRARIANFGFAATHGSQDDYNRYLKIARRAVYTVESGKVKSQLLTELASQLVYAGKSEPIFDLAKTIDESAERDRFLLNMAYVFSGYQQFVPAKKVVSEISDPAMRAVEEHRLLLAVLRASPLG